MSNVMVEPRVVAAGRGASWWAHGFRLFTARFWTWIGIMVIYFILSLLINAVPYVGNLGHWLLTPVFMGGIMLGCNAIERDEPLRVAHLFEGFQGNHFVPLMIIGAVNIGLALLIGGIATVGVLGSLKLADMAQLSGRDPLEAFLGSLDNITGTGLLLTLLILVIATVFAMLNWFAPAVVALRGATAIDAMKASFKSCLANWLPFAVYGLIAIVAGVVAMLGLGGLALLFGAGALFQGDAAGWIATAVIMVMLFVLLVTAIALVIGPVVFGSTYAGYVDTLSADDEQVANPAYH